ncbi:MAG: hypothetical protein LAN64_13245 [Acidobacteriia bacterium]|nr:hypothetical protein [Terriglobia bacterium]
MPMPESTADEVRSSVLRYLRLYEEGHFTLGDLAAELAVMTSAYEHVMGGIADSFGALLATASEYRAQSAADARASYAEFEQALTDFRRTEAAWD